MGLLAGLPLFVIAAAATSIPIIGGLVGGLIGGIGIYIFLVTGFLGIFGGIIGGWMGGTEKTEPKQHAVCEEGTVSAPLSISQETYGPRFSSNRPVARKRNTTFGIIERLKVRKSQRIKIESSKKNYK